MMFHDYKVSFVFLRCADPALDGQLVEVGHVNPKHPLSAIGKILLNAPELDLRYYLEYWIGELLGWVKRFYIPNLNYWAWINNPGYQEYEQFSPNDQQARDEIFYYLREAFVSEAESWKRYAMDDLQQLHSKAEAPDWFELEDERFSRIAWEEKRRRNRGT